MSPAAPAESLRERNRQLLRRRIVDSALQLVSSRGLTNVTADEIAAEAQVGRATFFRYFDSKEAAVIVGFYEERLTELVQALNEAPAKLGPLDAIAWSVRHLSAISTGREQKLTRMHARLVTTTPALRARGFEFHARYEQAIAAAVRPRFKQRRADDLRPRLLATATLAVMQTASEHWASRSRSSAADLTALVLDALEQLKLGFSEGAD